VKQDLPVFLGASTVVFYQSEFITLQGTDLARDEKSERGSENL
jgi:hypothetical protein